VAVAAEHDGVVGVLRAGLEKTLARGGIARPRVRVPGKAKRSHFNARGEPLARAGGKALGEESGSLRWRKLVADHDLLRHDLPGLAALLRGCERPGEPLLLCRAKHAARWGAEHVDAERLRRRTRFGAALR